MIVRTSFWRANLSQLIALILAASLWAGCSGCAPQRATSPPPPIASATQGSNVDPAHLYVLMINGGGNRQQNYQSHLLHVQHVLELVRATGVTDKHITVFSGDGNDPEPDVAVRELQAQRDQWLISGTHVDYALSNQITFVNSALPQLEPQPATKAAIGSWFDDAKKRLHPGDTLLLYVTDHGTRHPEHLDDNFIVLWGKEQLSVSELRALLNGLDPGVRVVMLMSQCFSGSFANLIDVHANDGIPNGNVCGFFSSTAERPAYGCYPENRGRNNVGHSFHFLQALGTTGNFTQSHLQVLVTDASPDVPLRTSDEYLERLLHEASANDDEAYKKLVDELLLEAWKDKGRWEPEIRLLDRIGHAYGTFSPRSLAEIEAQARQLPDIASQMKNSSRAWRGALSDSNEGNLGRFLDANPAWGDRLRPDALKDLTPETRGPLTTSLLHDLRGFTDAHPDVNQKLRTMRRHSREAATTSYRMEVRLGVVLRMRRVLSSIAGRLFVETRGTRQQREAYQALRSCEDLTLPGNNLPTPQLREAKSFPPLERDVTRAQAALPAWMGIQFREPKPETIAESNLAAGAATVITVYPDSPAAAAGLQPADIITGPPGKPFDEHGEVRSWIMLSKIGEPKKLEVLRDKEHLKMTIVPKLYPLKWPELPGPPKVGSVAPPIDISPYRGTLPTALAGNGSHLLFFWATWCAPCKASLPELLAFERERNVQVVAITDESKERLDPFFQQMKDFPQTVASDEFRKAFVAYGVSGTPTFVLVDDKGAVQAYTTGYDPKKGLGFEGWTWEKQKAGN